MLSVSPLLLHRCPRQIQKSSEKYAPPQQNLISREASRSSIGWLVFGLQRTNLVIFLPPLKNDPTIELGVTQLSLIKMIHDHHEYPHLESCKIGEKLVQELYYLSQKIFTPRACSLSKLEREDILTWIGLRLDLIYRSFCGPRFQTSLPYFCESFQKSWKIICWGLFLLFNFQKGIKSPLVSKGSYFLFEI